MNVSSNTSTRPLEGVTDAMIKENVTKVTDTIRYIYSITRGGKKDMQQKNSLLWFGFHDNVISVPLLHAAGGFHAYHIRYALQIFP